MASPAWFFSTLAQASAAIIGLTIAFTVSTHLSRRERRQNRTDQAREEGIQLASNFVPVLDSISQTIREETDISPSGGRYNLTPSDDLRNISDNFPHESSPVSIKLWALSSGISHILSQLTLIDSEVSRENLELLQNAVQELRYSVFYRGVGADEELYTEITGRNPSDSDTHYYFEDILDSHGRIGAWLDRNRTAREENMIASRPSDLTGENLFSWGAISEMLGERLDELGVASTETDVTADFLTVNFAQTVIISSMKIGFWGVFLPCLYLISGPAVSSIPFLGEYVLSYPFVNNYTYNTVVLLSEVAMFLFTSYYTLQIFLIMLLDIQATVPTMGELLGPPDEESSSETQEWTKMQRAMFGVANFVLPTGTHPREFTED